MTHSNNSNNTIFPFLKAVFISLAVVFIILKLLGKISWSWIWILSPIWIPFIVWLIAMSIIVRIILKMTK